nr:HAMP domain-containing sensor histidine kinase [Nocardioides luti]
MAVLLRSYALEDRLSRAALEVQATETVVSGGDAGAVSNYLERINHDDSETITTVLYPDGTAIGPHPGEDTRVRQARTTGQARVDDVDGGAEILVPVSLGSLGGGSPGPESTPVVRVEVREPGLGSGILRAWVVLAALGAVLLLGALFLADRLGRSFVQPIRRLASYAGQLGDRERPDPVPAEGPAEVRELTGAMNRLVGRVEVLLERERQGVADLSHRLRTPITALRLRIDALPVPADRDRLAEDLDRLVGMVDHVVSEARRSAREGLVAQAEAVGTLADRARFWEPLGEDQGRAFALALPSHERILVGTSTEDLVALLDVLLDNVFSHTPEGSPVGVSLAERAGGGVILTVDDGGPGFPADLDVLDRGTSGGGSTGLGLAIAQRTATESGGGLRVERSSYGGGRVVVELGPPA